MVDELELSPSETVGFDGHWSQVRLGEGSGRLAVGVAAKVAPAGRVFLGYFFGPARDDAPPPQDLARLRATDAVYVALSGDLGLMEGDWTIVGDVPPWRLGDRPVPELGRPFDGDRVFLAVSYSSDDVSAVGAERRISYDECAALPEDGVAVSGFVELRLTRLLDGAA